MIRQVFACYVMCSAVAIAILCTWLLLRKTLWDRYRGESRLFFWVLLAAFLIFPSGLITVAPKGASATGQVVYQSEKLLAESDIKVEARVLASNMSSSTSLDSEVHETRKPSQSEVMGFAAFIWISGVFVALMFEMISYLFFRRKVRRWGVHANSEMIKGTMDEVSHDMHVTRNVDIIVLSGLQSPCLSGLLRPCILLPREDYSHEEARLILKHEFTHYRKRHLWIKAFFLLARALHWFNPFVYVAWRYADADMECCCDEIMLSGENTRSRKKYMETLLNTINDQKAPHFTIMYARKNLIKERFEHIMNYEKKRKCVGFLSVMAAVIVLGSILAGCGVKEMEKKREDQVITSLGNFVNDFNGTIAGERTINLDQYMSNANLKRFSEMMLEYEKKQEAANQNAVNYGAENEFNNASCSKLKGDIYCATLQFENEGSGLTGQFLVELHGNGIDILDFYFGTPDGFDTITTGHLSERKVDDPERWNDEEWVTSVFGKAPSSWEYPIQPGSEEWSSMEITEAVAKLGVPGETVDAMTTQTLCETVLSYPLIDSIFAYDDTHFGITATKGGFYALDAFLQRKDAVSCLDDALSEAEAKLPGADENERLRIEDRKLIIKVLKNYITGEDYDRSSEREKKIMFSY